MLYHVTTAAHSCVDFSICVLQVVEDKLTDLKTKRKLKEQDVSWVSGHLDISDQSFMLNLMHFISILIESNIKVNVLIMHGNDV